MSLRIALAAMMGLGTLAARGDDLIREVSCRATSQQVPGYIDAKNLVSDEGLTEQPAGSGRWLLERGARQWNSNYGVVGGSRNDESPIVEFDLQKSQAVVGIRVWNLRAGGYGHRAFKQVSVQYSADGSTWSFLPQRFEFAQGPETGDHAGEMHRFAHPVKARYIRLWCHRTWRGPYGQPDVAGLGRVKFVSTTAPPVPAPRSSGRFPADAGAINVCEAPYHAKGDGRTDDTAAIQQALTDWQASRRPIYLPAGTYLVSATLRFKPGVLHGDNNLWGDGPETTTIRLAEKKFADPANPQAVICFGWHGADDPKAGVSADWFNNNIRDLTIEVAAGNYGAIGLQYYSNNAGAARNVNIRSVDGAGVIGLDLGYKDQNGPLLVKDLRVEGFACGVSTGNSVNSQTLRNVTLLGQTEVALRNTGQCLSVEHLRAAGPSPRIEHNWGFLTLVDTHLKADSPQESSAVSSGEFLVVRDLQVEGFSTAIDSRFPESARAAGPDVASFASFPVSTLFPGEAAGAPISVPAELQGESNPPAEWVNVRNFRRIDELDDTQAVQRAVDSGAATVYFPAQGGVGISAPIAIPETVRRLIGFSSHILRIGEGPTFVIENGSAPLEIRGLIDTGLVVNRSSRALEFRDLQGLRAELNGRGEARFENVVGELDCGPGQTALAWHFNAETLGTKLRNRGGTVRIVGLKTERGGTLIESTDGAVTEIWGGLCYTTNQGELAPMFVAHDSRLTAAIGEVCYTGNPYQKLVEETRGAETRAMARGESPRRFDFLQGSAVVFQSHSAPDG